MTKGDGLPCKKCGTAEWGDRGGCKQCARERTKEWKRNNPEKHRKNCRKWERNNPEKVKEKSRRWKRKNPEKVLEGSRRYYWNHPQKMRTRAKEYRNNNLERSKEIGRQYQANNPERLRAKNQKRRARKMGAEGNYTVADWIGIVNHQKGYCLACGKKKKLTVDHIVPLVLGGSNDPSNLQGLCKSCNSSKGDKIIDYRTDGGPPRWVQRKLLD